VQGILVEQHKFMKSKGINMLTQAGIVLANGTVFLSNFFAIKKMASADFPGFENGGTLWFTNLLATDPYCGLPIIAAASTALVIKSGIEMGASSDQMAPGIKLMMQIGFPAVVFISGFYFPAVSCF
jgi:YidC/Oxa1 family membrane protein insertase